MLETHAQQIHVTLASLVSTGAFLVCYLFVHQVEPPVKSQTRTVYNLFIVATDTQEARTLSKMIMDGSLGIGQRHVRKEAAKAWWRRCGPNSNKMYRVRCSKFASQDGWVYDYDMRTVLCSA